MRTLLACLLLIAPPALAQFGGSGSGGHTARRWNVVVFVADDLGEHNLNATFGMPDADPDFVAATPYLDALAVEGVVLTNAYSHPRCQPSRSSLLTGRHPFRSDLYNAAQASTSDNEVTLPDALRISPGASMAGRFGSFGKLGVALDTGAGRQEDSPGLYYIDAMTGTLEDVILDWSSWRHLRVTGVGGATAVAFDDPYSTFVDIATEADAEAWVTAREAADADLPWVVLVQWVAPHVPHDEPPALPGYYAGGACAATAAPLCFVENIEFLDALQGKFVAYLAANGWLEETLVVFWSDNGATFGAHGCKGTPYECGAAVPAVLAHGPVLNRGRSDGSLVQLEDVYATVLEAVQGQRSALPTTLPNDAGHAWYNGQALYLDSAPLWEIIVDGAGARGRDWIIVQSAFSNLSNWGVRRRGSAYKWVRRPPAGTEELFDVVADPGELTDLLLDGISAPEQAEVDLMRGHLVAELALEGRVLP